MCKELDHYLDELEKNKGLGAILSFAKKAKISRVSLWRYRNGHSKPNEEIRKKIKRITSNAVLPENFK